MELNRAISLLLRGSLVLVFMAGLLIVVALYPLSGDSPDWEPGIGAAPSVAAQPRTACADREPLRRAFFGDLHVHTALSWDGAGRGLQTTPAQAYRFAKGEEIGLPPYDETGRGARRHSLERPLDFAAVTDHAETIGEVNLCITPESSVYDTRACRAFRREQGYLFWPRGLSAMMAIRANARDESFCGTGNVLCREATSLAWAETRQAAEAAYDRSEDCSFTSFHAYEYTYAPSLNRVHRNVIFRNEVVPELPVSASDQPEPEGLWRELRKLCLDTDGDCDVLAIPHNPNHASGRMFPLGNPEDPIAERRSLANLRAQLEPLVEMMQVKGESECRNGLWGVSGEPDEFCELEKYTLPGPNVTDCQGGVGMGKSLGRGCVSRNDYARYAIAAGLLEQRTLGVNPYQLGFIGSTDTHNGTPGAVEEWNFKGSRGLSDATVKQRLKGPIQRNPGGLVGVWAEENSRDSLFDAMRRREVFATSGTRMTVRFFGGWGNFSSPQEESSGGRDVSAANWCERADAVAVGYREGVPMGEVLPSAGESEAPWFAVQASRDSGTLEHPGGLLQRLQLIKVTATADGSFHQQVFEVDGGANGADVDMASCEPRGAGSDRLCAVWRDPEFDPEESAAYYARVIENPSCRWTTWTCLSLPADERPALCEDPSEPLTTQERAWSSPIWYTPVQEQTSREG